MKRVREYVTKCVTILTVLNLVIWLAGGDVVAMAKCEDDQCGHGYHAFRDYYLKTADGKKHGTRYVYVSNDFKTQGCRGLIINGYLAWNMKGNNKIRLASVASKGKSQIRIEPEILGYGVCGMTYHKRNDKSGYTQRPMDELGGNYKYAKIEIHEAACLRENVFTQIATHETGHALGLSHVTCRKSIMCLSVHDAPNRIASPSSADLATLRHVYNAYK